MINKLIILANVIYQMIINQGVASLRSCKVSKNEQLVSKTQSFQSVINAFKVSHIIMQKKSNLDK